MSKSYFSPDSIQISGLENCSIYHWNDRDVNHYFCRTCGIYPFHDSIYKPGHYRVNLACIDGLDITKLQTTVFDGRDLL